MAWPTVAELKQRLDITSDDWDDQLERLLEAAIAETKLAVGEWVEGIDSPDDALAQSAMEKAVELGSTGESVAEARQKSKLLLYGQRKRFGIA